jgi:hypothetical protein
MIANKIDRVVKETNTIKENIVTVGVNQNSNNDTKEVNNSKK